MSVHGFVRAADQFPLGSLCGPVAEGGPGLMPFGLRYATAPGPGGQVELDWTLIGYDPARQIATVSESDQVVPVMRHTSGNTTTSTASQDRSGGDSDNDTTQD